jgi:hypothetical protein
VPRLLAALFSLLMIGTAAAQPPVDFTLLCDGAVIGTASYVDGELHAALLVGATCEGERTVAQDGSPYTLERDEATGVVTVTIGDLSGVAIEVPQTALDGKVGATENRAAAAERRGHGEETSAAKRAEHQPERPDRPERPEDPETPDEPEAPDAPETPEGPDRPELPELPVTAGGRRP